MATRRRGTGRSLAARLSPRRHRAGGGRPGLRLPAATRVGLVALLVCGLLIGGFLVGRDSSLFAVRHVEVNGATGPSAPRMVAALKAAARGMTTLHLDRRTLRRSLSTFPQVKGIRARRVGRSGLRVEVIEYVPVGAVAHAGQRIPVAADGTLLRGVPAAGGLATIPVKTTTAGRRLSDRAGVIALEAIDSAPAALRARIAQADAGARGATVSLRDGPQIYFGAPERLGAKWAAAVAVLADDSSRGARYVDVRTPERPAAGGLPAGQDETSPSVDFAPPPTDATGAGSEAAGGDATGAGSADASAFSDGSSTSTGG
jgi:cell division protein FtsQ